jgi:multiple sugar transport system substrate-binding protein
MRRNEMLSKKSKLLVYLVGAVTVFTLAILVLSACAPTTEPAEEAVVEEEVAEPEEAEVAEPEEAEEAEPEEAAEAEEASEDLEVEEDVLETPQYILDYTASVTPAEKQYDGVTITIAIDGLLTGQGFTWYAEAIKERFDINVELVPLGFFELYQEIINDLVTGTGAYDILVYPPRHNGDLAASGYIVPLDIYIEQWDVAMDDVIPVYRELYNKVGDDTVSLMYDGDKLELYYRKDLFEHPDEMAAFEAEYGYPLGVPETWDQYLDVAEFFTRDAGETLAGETLSDPFYGMAEIARAPDNLNWFLNRFASAGGIYFDEEMNPVIAGPEGITALEDYKAAIQYGPPDILNYAYVETYGAFLGGTTAMVIQWPDIARSAENPELSEVVGKVGYALIPGYELDGEVNHRPSLAYGRVMAISSLSENPEAAFRVMQFINDPEVSFGYATSSVGGIDPFRLSTYEEPGKWVMQWDGINAYIENGKAGLVTGFPELTIPGAVRYNEALTRHIASALAGEETVEVALELTAQEWDVITDELGRELQLEFWQAELARWRELGLVP